MCDSYLYRTRLLSPSRRSGRFDGWAVWPRKERSGEGSRSASGAPRLFSCARTRAKPVPARRPLKGRFAPGLTLSKLAYPPGKGLVAGSRDRSPKLLGPPIRLALIHLRLELADVLGEVALLLPQPKLELADGLLTLLELDLAHLRVRLQARPAGLDLGLALLQFALTVGDRLLGLPQPLLAAVDPRTLRLEQR